MNGTPEPWSLLTPPPVEWVQEKYLGLHLWKQRYIWERYRTVVLQTTHKLYALLRFAEPLDTTPDIEIQMSIKPVMPVEYIELKFKLS